jgi:predicted transcriptional regulator
MSSETTSIEIDRETALFLERRAAERGVTVAQLVAELVPTVADASSLAELERRWQSVEAGSETVPHEDVVRWLETWGTPSYRPWRER